jgi:hypothetical protein
MASSGFFAPLKLQIPATSDFFRALAPFDPRLRQRFALHCLSFGG